MAGSQILAVLLFDTDVIRFLSYDQTIERTISLYSIKIEIYWPVVGSQILAVLLFDTDTNRFLFYDQTIEYILSLYSTKINIY